MRQLRKFDPGFKTLRKTHREQEVAQRTTQETWDRASAHQKQKARAQHSAKVATTSARMRAFKHSKQDGDFPGGVFPLMHHEIGQSRDDSVRILNWLADNEGDPAIKVRTFDD